MNCYISAVVKRYFIALSLFWFVTVNSYAQSASSVGGFADKSHYLVDSLKLDELTQSDRNLLDSALTWYHKAAHDTDKLNALSILCENMMHQSWHKYQFLHYQMIKGLIKAGPPPALHKKYLLSLAEALNNIGYIYNDQGDITKALEYYHKSLIILEETRLPDGQVGSKSGIATSLNNIGYIYEHQGDIPKALEYYHNSLKIREEIGDKKGIAESLNNIGYIYDDQGDIPKALEYYHKSLKIVEEIGNKSGIASSLNNIGVIYYNQGVASTDLSPDVSDEASAESEAKAKGEASAKLEHFTKALEYYHKSLIIEEEIGNKSGIAASLNNIGYIELEQGKLTNSLNYAMRGLEMAREIGDPHLISKNSGLLSKVAKKQGNLTTDPVLRQARFEEALEMYELHILMRDSIKNEENQKATIRQQTKYEFEKAQLVKEQEEKEAARIVAEETSRRDNLQYSVILIAILVLFGGVLALGFINVSERMAEGITFFSFLILFEFLLVLADPYIDKWSGGAPGIKLLFNAGIAALIFPAHAFFESRLKGRLAKK